MSKRWAQSIAREECLSFGDLRRMIEESSHRFPNANSEVNPALSHEQACGILLRAIAERPGDEIPKAWRVDPYSARGALKPSRDFLIVVNILRECAP